MTNQEKLNDEVVDMDELEEDIEDIIPEKNNDESFDDESPKEATPEEIDEVDQSKR